MHDDELHNLTPGSDRLEKDDVLDRKDPFQHLVQLELITTGHITQEKRNPRVLHPVTGRSNRSESLRRRS